MCSRTTITLSKPRLITVEFGFCPSSPRGQSFFAALRIIAWRFLKPNLRPSWYQITGMPMPYSLLHEAFFGPGGENPESYFSAFSSSLLEAALNHTSQSNQYGQLFQVDPDECRDLRELNLAIGFANFTGGSMTAPYYNSRATKIAVVTNGEGYFEMACPHLSSLEFGAKWPLSRGVVFIVPPGHPVITVASKNQNLQIVYFDVNALNNEKFPLAGRRNIINQLSPEAKELAFNAPAREVDEVFKNQEDEFFFEGPRQQHEREHENEHEEGRAYA
ncbi:Vicilin-like antimicrobial peptides 2-2 [Camellia lanceoleosa]|uniref:Vicilin-like antimicrobial peptides 2-2 n=1 Tax=Camellia lanceoleosa TaxID=1840588 RepID=A0ACC0FSH2_9ERIC|nr:Vicilin-like antimicrobial peptides 2-2 [Camellia lanceoleosa]